MKTTTTIELCNKCNGKGIIEIDIVTDYHKSEYRIESHTCRSCLGSGRIKVITITTREPFIPEGKDDAQ